MSKNSDTTYAKIVKLKKKFFKSQLIPSSIGKYIDGLFNSVHNLRIHSKDVARDVTIHSRDILRDSIILTKDIARDNPIRLKDIARDNMLKTRDIARDNIIRTKDTTKDLLIQTKDVTRDNVIQTRDTTRDLLIRTKVLTRNNIIRTKDINQGFISRNRDLLSPRFIYSLFKHVGISLQNIKYVITEKSDQNTVSFIGTIVANSQNVKQRITKYYKRDSTIIHPPVESPLKSPRLDEKDEQELHIKKLIKNGFWLSVNRITPEKRIGIQIEAFKKDKLIHETLLIVGGYDHNSRRLVSSLVEQSPKNVHILGSITHETLSYLYSTCKGLITTSLDEDFGMNVIEAMSYGKPVIAPNEGGYRETLVHGETGILIDNLNGDALANSINTVKSNLVKNPSFYNKNSSKRAELFNSKHFAEKIKKEIQQNLCDVGDKKLVFIVGVPRSGTTWLWGLLTSHPDIEALQKSDFGEIPGKPASSRDSIETNMLFDRSLSEIAEVIKSKQKTIILEKTPDHLLKVGYILNTFPHAKIIHIVRNPFSVFASYKFSDWNRKITNVKDWLVEYKRRMDVFNLYKENPRILTVSYEKLHQNTEKTLLKVTDFIGLKNPPIEKMVLENKGISKATGRHAIRKALPNGWKDELRHDELEEIKDSLWKYKFLRNYFTSSYISRLARQLFSKDKKQMVFIVGIPRSGTTWLWKLLAEHSYVAVLTREDFEYKDIEKDNRELNTIPYRRTLQETNMFDDFSMRVIKKVIKEKEKNIIIEKTPLHILRLDTIRKEFPNAKIIHITRDPISVYASYTFTEFRNWEHTGISVQDWVKLYKEMFYQFYPTITDKSILSLSYEDMLKNPTNTLEEACDFIGISKDFIQEALDKMTFEKEFPKIHKVRGVNSLREKVTPEDIKYINDNLREEIELMKGMTNHSL